MSGSLLNFGPCSFMSLTCDHFAANRLSQASNLICRNTVPVGGLMLLCVRRWWLLLPSEDSLERISSLAHSQGYGKEMVLVGCWAEDLIPGWLLIRAFLTLVPCHVGHTGQDPTWQLASPRMNKGEVLKGGKWLCNLILGVLFYFFRHGYLFRNTFTWVWRPWSGLSAICSGRWLHSELVSWSSKIELLLGSLTITFTHIHPLCL